MRDIKFRAWDKKTRQFVIHPDSLGGGKDYDISEIAYWNSVIDRVELMQYTGLKDKNGMEIYESDILEYIDEYIQEDLISYLKGIVTYTDGGFQIDNKGLVAEWGTVKVIGNIYENKENE